MNTDTLKNMATAIARIIIATLGIRLVGYGMGHDVVDQLIDAASPLINEIMVGAVMLVAALVMSIYQKLYAAALMKAALNAPKGTTIATVKEMAKEESTLKGALVASILLSAMLFTGCALSDAMKAKASATASYAGKKAFAVAQGVLMAAVSDYDREKKWNFTQSLGDALRTQQGNLLTSDDVRDLIEIWTPNKPHWTNMAADIADAYAKANPQTPEEAKRILEAIAKGIQEAK